MTNFISDAADVIRLEIKGLEALERQLINPASRLSVAFENAVGLIKGAKGRVIVSGMGKSGHVGRKIAATLASTGQPASFVHPAEASHGDLGMIAKGDVVIALSNSGETPELSSLIDYCRRFDIALIAITSGESSALGNAADACLLLPKAQEACGETRAPTTSTTMAMALGDALAVTLLRDKGFKASDFKNFHPGGKLGAALRKVKDIMHHADELPLCAPDTKITDLIHIIAANNYGCAGVVENGQILGVITDGDIRRNVAHDIAGKTARDLMTKDPVFVTPDMLASDALGLLSQRQITALFVCEDNKPIGILHIHDFLSLGVI